MGLSAFATILLFVVCLAGGIAIGFLLARYLKPAPDVPGDEPKEKEPITQEPVFVKPREPAQLQVGRTKKNALWLEMADQRWENPDDLPTDSRKELTTIVKELGAWVEPSPEILPEQKEVSAPDEYELKPAKTSLFSRSYSPWRTPKKEPPLPAKIEPVISPLSIVTQIDAILQKKLVDSPFSNLDIHLLESPTGEVNVLVGAVRHPAVDSIPNPEIKELIRQAVAEWEKTVH